MLIKILCRKQSTKPETFNSKQWAVAFRFPFRSIFYFVHNSLRLATSAPFPLFGVTLDFFVLFFLMGIQRLACGDPPTSKLLASSFFIVFGRTSQQPGAGGLRCKWACGLHEEKKSADSMRLFSLFSTSDGVSR